MIAATLLDLKAARLLPAGEVDDTEDLALLEVRDLLFARLLQYRAFKHVAEMFAELEAAALRSYPRSVALEERYSDLLPEVMIGVDAQSFAEIAAAAFTPVRFPRSEPTIYMPRVSVPEQAERLLDLRAPGSGAVGVVLGPGGRLRRADPDRRPVPGFARAVPLAGGSIRAVGTAWDAAGFRGPATGWRTRTDESRVGRMMTEEDTGESVAEDADLAVEAEDATAEFEYVLDEILDEDELVRILDMRCC